MLFPKRRRRRRRRRRGRNPPISFRGLFPNTHTHAPKKKQKKTEKETRNGPSFFVVTLLGCVCVCVVICFVSVSDSVRFLRRFFFFFFFFFFYGSRLHIKSLLGPLIFFFFFFFSIFVFHSVTFSHATNTEAIGKLLWNEKGSRDWIRPESIFVMIFFMASVFSFVDFHKKIVDGLSFFLSHTKLPFWSPYRIGYSKSYCLLKPSIRIQLFKIGYIDLSFPVYFTVNDLLR